MGPPRNIFYHRPRSYGEAPKAGNDFNLGDGDCIEVLKIEQAVFV